MESVSVPDADLISHIYSSVVEDVRIGIRRRAARVDVDVDRIFQIPNPHHRIGETRRRTEIEMRVVRR